MKNSTSLFTLLILFTLNVTAQTTLSTASTNQPIDLDTAPPAVQASITKAINQATQEADEVWLSNPNFNSHFTKNAFSLTPKGNDLVWEWQLKSINGQAAKEATPRLREAYQKELVDYKRGNITERYVFHRENIEQQFIVHDMPAVGHLRIEGDITSGGTFQKETDHWLWANEHSSVKLGQLYVYDATGATIPADFEVCADYTSITIDEAALAMATFPVTIDPEIGPNDFRISTMGADSDANFDANNPAVAYNSVEDSYLVVWDGDEAVGNIVNDEFEIYGQRIDAAGTLIQQRFRISFQGTAGSGANFDATNPSVAYNPITNDYLVVWHGDEDVAPLVDDEFEIFGQLVNNVGQLIDSGGNIVTESNFRISDMGTDGNANFDAINPKVAYNSAANNYLVVWEGDDSLNDKIEIYGQRIGANGAGIGTDFQISNQGASGNANFDALNANLAYNSQENEFLVVWEGDTDDGGLANDEFEIYGQLLTATGSEIGADFKISDMENDGNNKRDATRADVAYNSIENNYLVAWIGDNQNSNDDFDIHGQLIDNDGTEVGINDFQISDIHFFAEGTDRDPSIAFSAMENQYLVTWAAIDQLNGQNVEDIWGQYLDPAGHQIKPNDFRISEAVNRNGNNVRDPFTIFNSTNGEFLTVWSGQEDNLANDKFEIHGQRLEVETPPDDQFRISFQDNDGDANFDAFDPAIAYNTLDSTYLVVWSGDRTNDEFEIFGQLISNEGFLLDFPIRLSQVDGNANFDALNPAIAYNSIDNNYLVVWEADVSGLTANDEYQIFGQLVDARGIEFGSEDFRISEMGPFNNNNFNALNPSVAYNSMDNNYIVVWEGDDDFETVDDEFEIFGNLVTNDGSREYQIDLRISAMGPNNDTDFGAFDPDISYNSTDNNFLVVWQGDSDDGSLIDDEFEIFGQRLDRIGDPIGTKFRISEQGPNGNPFLGAFTPSVAYNSGENDYLVVWSGDFNSGSALPGELEIFGQLIDNDGTDINTDFRISDMGTDGDIEVDAFRPDVVYSSIDDTYLVVWHASGTDPNVPDIGGIEIYGQFLTSSGAELGINDFRISQQGPDGDENFDGQNPSVAFNPINNNFLVVWEGDDIISPLVNDEFEIFGELIEPEAGVDPCLVQLTDTQIGLLIDSGLYQASDEIISSGLIINGNDVIFDAGIEINLLPGFEVELGALFETLLDGCSN